MRERAMIIFFLGFLGTIWKVEELKDNSVYGRLYQTNYYGNLFCEVATRRDESGVQLSFYARRGSQRISFESITIEKVNGAVRAERQCSNLATRLWPGKPCEQIKKIPWCEKEIRELPPEVKKLFFGFGGIQE